MKKYIFALLFLAIFIFSTNIAKAETNPFFDCSINRVLKVGSRGTDVACLQGQLGVYADGMFGKMTRAAVVSWQKGAGIAADGVFGSISRATWIALVTKENLPEGCTTTSGFSPTTGKPCTPSKKDSDITIVTPAILPDAAVGIYYVVNPKAVGGIGNTTWNNYGWTLTAGSLPPGVNMVDSNFVSGTPTTPGTYTFSLTASNGKISVSKEFTLTVDSAASVTN